MYDLNIKILHANLVISGEPYFILYRSYISPNYRKTTILIYRQAKDNCKTTKKCNYKIYIKNAKMFICFVPKTVFLGTWSRKQRINFPAFFSNEICRMTGFSLIDYEQNDMCRFHITCLKRNYLLLLLFFFPSVGVRSCASFENQVMVMQPVCVDDLVDLKRSNWGVIFLVRLFVSDGLKVTTSKR